MRVAVLGRRGPVIVASPTVSAARGQFAAQDVHVVDHGLGRGIPRVGDPNARVGVRSAAVDAVALADEVVVSPGCSCLIYLSVRTEDEGSGAGLVYLPNCDERLAEVGDRGAADEGSS